MSGRDFKIIINHLSTGTEIEKARMDDSRMTTTQNINLVKEMRKYFRLKNNFTYVALRAIRRWLVTAVEIIDKLTDAM